MESRAQSHGLCAESSFSKNSSSKVAERDNPVGGNNVM